MGKPARRRTPPTPRSPGRGRSSARASSPTAARPGARRHGDGRCGPRCAASRPRPAPVISAWMPKLRRLTRPPAARICSMAVRRLPCAPAAVQPILATKSNRDLSCHRATSGVMRPTAQRTAHHGERTHGKKSKPCPARQDAALAALVRQPGQSGHDRALSRALSQLRPDQQGAALRQADHRHRADRLGPVALQPPSSRAGAPRARRHPRRPAASRSSFRAIRSRRPASGRPRRSTATSPISAWSRCCTAIRSTAWC